MSLGFLTVSELDIEIEMLGYIYTTANSTLAWSIVEIGSREQSIENLVKHICFIFREIP